MQIRAYIKAIFAEAVDQDFLPKDPARTLKTPANLRETDKTVLSWEQLAFMDPSNYRKRVLHKLATELGLPKLTFQVIRRTIATLAQKKGQ